MIVNLCTYFDRNYLLKGLALLQSIERHIEAYQVFVLCLDANVAQAIHRLYKDDPRIMPIMPAQLEQRFPELLRLQAERSPKEYIWSLTAPLLTFVFERFGYADLAYIDADCYFFSDPAPLYAEVAGKSIGIIPHRWTPRHAERLRPNGVYNVGWVYFRNDKPGRACLHFWQLESEHWKGRPGTFSDQRFLDGWPPAYGDDLRKIEHIGANVAPWNQEQYEFTQAGDCVYLTDPTKAVIDRDGLAESPRLPLIFYHFHELRNDASGYVPYRSGYPLAQNVGRAIYEPYERALHDAARIAWPA